jgi:putative flippase GtrA
VGRSVLVSGGIGTVLVAAFPQPVRGNSIAHTVAATVAFVALAAWPVLASRRETGLVLLRRGAAIPATCVLFGLILWFVLEVHGSHRGLAERSAALGEALWPLAVVVATRWGPASRGAARPLPTRSAAGAA